MPAPSAPGPWVTLKEFIPTVAGDGMPENEAVKIIERLVANGVLIPRRTGDLSEFRPCSDWKSP
jgi:hypothetical protein